MTALLYLLGVVTFVAAILVSIGLHELGHLIPAKAFGTKVTQYFIGFGRTLWSTRRGETEWGVKAIPLGGYVKIVGMLPPGDGRAETVSDAGGSVRVRQSNTGMFTQLISDARSAEYELVGPEDSERLFYQLPWWKKVIVMAGGPLVNIAIAFFLFFGVFASVGNASDPTIEPVVDTVAACVVPAAEDGRKCTAADPQTPAMQAGLRQGDEFIEFNGAPITDWRDLQQRIRANSDGAAEIVIKRDGKLLTVKTNTTVTARPTDADHPEKLTQVGFLGVVPVATPTVGGPVYTIEQMGGMAKSTVQALATLPVKVWGVAKAIVGVEERAADSPVSIVGGGRLAGEVAAHQEIVAKDKLVSLVMLIGAFNFFIGMFNLVPLLPLDGGHIAGALYEAARRGVAKLFGRPDPGYFDTAKLLPVAYVVGAAMLLMGVVLIIGDVVVPIHLPG